jgi:hypothetical protein
MKFCPKVLEWGSAGLESANLKGDDYYRAHWVADSCGKVGDFGILLVSMQKEVRMAVGSANFLYETDGAVSRQQLGGHMIAIRRRQQL